jgi:hypothetical protein
MDNMTLIAIASIVTAGLTIALGSIKPALGEGRAVATARQQRTARVQSLATLREKRQGGRRPASRTGYAFGTTVDGLYFYIFESASVSRME